MSDILDLSLPTDEDRRLLRDSLRGFLQSHWPAEEAVARQSQPDLVAQLWQGLGDQGLLSLGSDATEGGVREMVVVMEELGRAAVPIPFHGLAVAQWLMQKMAQHSDSLTDGFLPGSSDAWWKGQRRLAVALDPLDSTLEASSGQAGAWSGGFGGVEGGLSATDLWGVLPSGAWVQVSLSAPGVSQVSTRLMGSGGAAQVTLNGVRAQQLPMTDGTSQNAQGLVRLLLLARAHGAARRAFDMVVDYAKERHQFGQPIGKFQAIQHKLANVWMSLEAVDAMLSHAATQMDQRGTTSGAQDATTFALWAAVAHGSAALRSASLEIHHAFGAIGYAEDHEAPRHFRRVHLDTLGFGGPATAREALASYLLDHGRRPLPEIDLGSHGNAFRQEVRRWLATHWSGERKAAFDAQPFHDREFDATFARDLGTTGWIGLSWPAAFGGQGRTPREQIAFMEEMERAEAPRAGASVQANALMMYGTPAQKERYLPEILRGEAMHGMGYSEPNAGSDLASLKTTAVRVRDERDERGAGWLINGQKIWTTTWWGQYMFLAARTDPQARPAHAGISMFVVPMASPGITVKPSSTMYDGTFANIFYDDVWVPEDALIGPENGGWKVLTDALANERGMVGGGIVLKVVHAFEQLCEDLADAPGLLGDPRVRDQVGQFAADIEVGRQLMMRCALLAESGTTPPEMGALSKVFSGELFERFGQWALEVLGPRALRSQEAPDALRHGRYEQGLRHSLMWVISIGTNEIQRSLMAQRGLGLPR